MTDNTIVLQVDNTTIIETISTSTIVSTEYTQPTVISQPERGVQGIQGISAYQVALNNGFIGTESEWLYSLTAPIAVLVNRVYLPASRDIGGHRVCISTELGVDYADNTTPDHINRVVGISNNSAITGDLVTIISEGEISGLSGLSVGLSVYVSTNGEITQIVPTTGFIQKIGIAISSNSILINIQLPIQQL